MQLAGIHHLLQLGLDPGDALADQTAVDFQLAFTGTAEETETAALALQVGPRPHQARALVIQMRQFDLQAAFPGAGAGAEYLEDQPGAVDYLGLQRTLQVALLHRRDGRIDDDHIDRVSGDVSRQLLDPARADQRGRPPAGDRTQLGMDDLEVDGARQPDRLFEAGFRPAALVGSRRFLRGFERRMNDERALDAPVRFSIDFRHSQTHRCRYCNTERHRSGNQDQPSAAWLA